VVKPLEATQIMIRHWIAASLLLALGVMLLPASGYAQSSDPEQQKKEQEFISEVNRKIEREFQIREKILAEKEQKKREEEAKGQQAEAAKHQFSSMWGRTVPNYMFDSYTLSEPPLRKR
jgi:septal ring factor EnvC (AmiA/AmiB activator)